MTRPRNLIHFSPSLCDSLAFAATVDAFWSVSVYNAAGYFQKNPANAYTVNNLTAKKGGNGAIAIQFGGCDGQVPNCLPVVEGWNYTVRLYRPRAEVLSGAWNFPQPQPVN
nr:DUF1214 domain-containing protein [Cupriavidus alkaliphilus]